MKKIVLILLSLSVSAATFCQETKDVSQFNFDFEAIKENRPEGWSDFGSKEYTLSMDSVIRTSGKYSAVIEYTGTTVGFRAWVYTIPGSYAGKKITLTGYIKTENVTDAGAGLWMRIDPNIAFDNMQSRGIKGTTDWKKYEITLDLDPAKTKQIVIGGLLNGKGKIWIDDLEVSVDGKDIRGLEPIAQKEYPADKDKEFDKGSTISSIGLTESKINDLVVLGKVWGFLKYYHPAVAKGNYNWDYELFRVLPKVLNAKDQAERNTILSTWVDNLGKVETIYENKSEKGEAKIKPDLAWIENSTLGEKLAVQLTDIKNAKRTGDNYYIALAPGVLNPQFTNERPYKEIQYPDAGYRLLCLYRYWNVIQYFFPYKNLIGENWNDVLKEYVPKFVNAQDEIGYKQTVLSFIARVHDTHASIYGKDNTLEYLKGVNYAPVEITFVENKAVVTGYYDKTLGEKSGLKTGDVIETVNDKPVDEIIKEKLPLTPASNYPTQLRNIAYDLLRTNVSMLKISYKRDSSSFNTEIECFDPSGINTFSKFQKKDTCFKIIDSDIAYLYPGSIKNEYLPKIIPEILKSKGLVIDMRCYPSEFIVFTFGRYLVPKATDFVKFSNGSITSPGLFTITDDLKVGAKNKDFYKGKVVIIVNENTQSQAEYTTMAFRTAPQATVIGSTTAGADGNVSAIVLPAGIMTMISGIGIYCPDGKETQRVGIVPDITIQPTIKGIKEGKDELLEKAIGIINAK